MFNELEHHDIQVYEGNRGKAPLFLTSATLPQAKTESRIFFFYYLKFTGFFFLILIYHLPFTPSKYVPLCLICVLFV
jgi:hypothetical protein